MLVGMVRLEVLVTTVVRLGVGRWQDDDGDGDEGVSDDGDTWW